MRLANLTAAGAEPHISGSMYENIYGFKYACLQLNIHMRIKGTTSLEKKYINSIL